MSEIVTRFPSNKSRRLARRWTVSAFAHDFRLHLEAFFCNLIFDRRGNQHVALWKSSRVNSFCVPPQGNPARLLLRADPVDHLGTSNPFSL